MSGAGGLESDTPSTAGIPRFCIKTGVSVLQRGGLGLDTESAPLAFMAFSFPSPFSSSQPKNSQGFDRHIYSLAFSDSSLFVHLCECVQVYTRLCYVCASLSALLLQPACVPCVSVCAGVHNWYLVGFNLYLRACVCARDGKDLGKLPLDRCPQPDTSPWARRDSVLLALPRL